MKYFSASRIKTLTDCKKLFYHKYVLESLPREPDSPFAQLGSTLHTCLEIYRPNADKMQRKDVVALFKEKVPFDKKHFLYRQGIGILYNLDYKMVVRGKLEFVEWEFEKPVLGYQVKGFVDKIERIGENILLCTDYKSNKDMIPELYIMQLAIYDAAIKDVFPGFSVEHELLYLRHNKSVPFIFTDKSHNRVKSIFESTNNMIVENKDYAERWPKMDRKGKACGYCPLSKKCWT